MYELPGRPDSAAKPAAVVVSVCHWLYFTDLHSVYGVHVCLLCLLGRCTEAWTMFNREERVLLKRNGSCRGYRRHLFYDFTRTGFSREDPLLPTRMHATDKILQGTAALHRMLTYSVPAEHLGSFRPSLKSPCQVTASPSCMRKRIDLRNNPRFRVFHC